MIDVSLLVAFAVLEAHARVPMFQLGLFRIRAFTAGCLATLLIAVARGGMQFMPIIWLQGVWLPLHGYRFEDTPLWAGIYMLPPTVGFLLSGPLSGRLSDRHGSRAFATTGAVLTGLAFVGLMLLPVDFDYPYFALILALSGIGQGMFGAPNTSAIMGSVPAGDRGVASGMRATFQNSGMALSIGVFFTLMTTGLARALPSTLSSGLQSQGVPAATATSVSHLPPVSTLFATFLGHNPIRHLLGPDTVNALPPHNAETLTGSTFFPHLISGPFHHGLQTEFTAAAIMSAAAPVASVSRGRRQATSASVAMARNEGVAAHTAR